METDFDFTGHDFYRKSMQLLDEAGVPYLVGGAFALRAYTGVVRDTKDFDLMVLPHDLPRALDVFHAAGYRAEVTFSHWLAKAHRGEFFIDIIFNSGNGVCPVDEEWIAHAREGELFGTKVRICPPEELIWQKAYIMERERFDGGDVVHLIRSCGSQLDWERLLRRFGPDWRVLFAHLVLFSFIYPSKKDLIPVGILRELGERWTASLSEPAPSEKICNGTLLSRAQYLPDIERWGFQDARSSDRVAMTPQQLEAWTSAIEDRVFRR